jgi:hypothetical protein
MEKADRNVDELVMVLRTPSHGSTEIRFPD